MQFRDYVQVVGFRTAAFGAVETRASADTDGGTMDIELKKEFGRPA